MDASKRELRSSSVRNKISDAEIRQVPCDAFSCTGSKCSSKSDSARSRLVLAQLKRKQTKAKLELESRELEIRRERELLQVDQDVEFARVEAELENEVEDGPSPEGRFDEATLEAYLDDCRTVRGNGLTSTQEQNKPTPAMEVGALVGEQLIDIMRTLRLGSELPRVELMPFSGEPAQFWKFSRQFEYYVESKVSDEGQRLLYLLHYCRGVAKEAVEECIMLPPEKGYRMAKELLKQQFGQPHHIARSLLDGLINNLKPNAYSAQDLTSLANRMGSCHITLKEMKYTADMDSLATVEAIVRSLSRTMQYQWADHVDKLTEADREPVFSDLLNFISKRARVARSRFGQLADSQPRFPRMTNITRPTSAGPAPPGVRRSIYFTDGQGVSTCILCPETHELHSCPKFLGLTVSGRWDIVKQFRTCFKCLRLGHPVRLCPVSSLCGFEGCQGKHHTLLHAMLDMSTGHVNQGVTEGCPRGISLGIIPVRVMGDKESVVTYALLDSGSDTTLISNSLAHKLQLTGDRTAISITGVSGTRSVDTRRVSLTVCSIHGDNEVQIDSAVCLEQIPVRPPDTKAIEATRNWSHLSDVPTESIPGGRVELLIGCDTPEAHWVLDQRLGGKKQPYAVKTPLGWVVFGPLSLEQRFMTSVNCLQRSEPSIDELLRKLYDAEFDDQNDQLAYSVEDNRVLEHVTKYTVRVDGKYCVPLPWRNSAPPAVNNRWLADKRAVSLKHRLSRDASYCQRYMGAMQQNFEKRHAVRVDEYQLSPEFPVRFYLPHHGVINPKKPEKLRVVLDCAAKFQGSSLNDYLLTGPDVTTELISVLLRFRQYPVAVAADIEEMFMQVRVPEADRAALRFLWWPYQKFEDRPVEYQMTAHPFGATSSPFCATYALRRTAEDFGVMFDEDVRDSLVQNFYVDDYMNSVLTVEEGERIVPQVRDLVLKGGFRLRKWTSNVTEVLKDIPDSERSLNAKNVTAGSISNDRMLGLEWDAIEDVFILRFELDDKPLTRRGILSAISSLYDPLGVASPVILPAKLLLQRLCKDKLGWDEQLDVSQKRNWNEWINRVRRIESVRFPRCIGRDVSHYGSKVHLHIFCDASEKGYGAVAYALFRPKIGPGYCTILLAKSRVAPMKAVTIPRLELNAAVLATRLEAMVKKGMRFEFASSTFWTDSLVVLYCIRNESKRFSTFVANRIALIHGRSNFVQWRHVNTADNPADMASRGITSSSQLDTWLKGPTFLLRPISTWPNIILDPPQADLEFKRNKAEVFTSSRTAIENCLSPMLMRFSSWNALVRSVAWLTRFKVWIAKRARGTSTVASPSTLKVDELRNAEEDIFRIVQHEAFHEDMIGWNGPVDPLDTCFKVRRGSSLTKLSPTMMNGLLCLRGRLAYAAIDDRQKNPIILPCKHPVVDLLIRHCHCIEGHSGPNHVLSCIRRKYWIVHGGRAVRRVIGRCITCRRRCAKVCEQQMAPLPLARIEKGCFPFEHTGIDYFGPLFVKRGRCIEKRYGCVFTCLKIRAIHIEVSSDLSTDAFLSVLTRFIGRRGCPTDIYSDNGTNFVGAARELRAVVSAWDHSRIANESSSKGIQWHFNPPVCSHRGGIWERMIRSVRKIFYGLCGTQRLTDDTLHTFSVEVERILNNRPLVPETSSHMDPPAITPNDLLFVHRRKLEIDVETLRSSYTRRWRQVDHLASSFWRRWSSEYLRSLQLRQKWQNPKYPLEAGDLVLVSSENTTRDLWPLGIVLGVEHSQDGLVRTVNIRTAKGDIRRDVRRVCRLEGDEPRSVVPPSAEDPSPRHSVTSGY